MSEQPTPRTDTLWCALMDSCRVNGIHPSNANSTFKILDDFRQLERELSIAQAQIAEAEEKRRDAVRKCEELCSYYATRQAIRAAFPEDFK